MKRAIILIVVLTVTSLAAALTVDLMQHHTALEYLKDLPPLREAVLRGDMEDAKIRQVQLRKEWDEDAFWLNCLISHHYTREVSGEMESLHTAIEQGWKQEALLVMDRLDAAFDDIESGDFCRWENFL